MKYIFLIFFESFSLLNQELAAQLRDCTMNVFNDMKEESGIINSPG